jgi:transcription elongation factor GreB
VRFSWPAIRARDSGKLRFQGGAMNKAFVRESEASDDDELDALPIAPGTRNYLTPEGYRRLHAELLQLIDVDRPEVVRTVSWAASNGDRSENGDYIYGKRRLREIDRRIRFLTKRLDIAEVVDASLQENKDRVFFGATVRYADASGKPCSIRIVGVDEAEPLRGMVSWVSPIARALTKAQVGDLVNLRTPSGVEELEVLEVSYPDAQR